MTTISKSVPPMIQQIDPLYAQFWREQFTLFASYYMSHLNGDSSMNDSCEHIAYKAGQWADQVISEYQCRFIVTQSNLEIH